MAILDAPLRTTARSILEKFGAPVTVTLRDSAGGYDTGAGQEPQTPTTVQTFALETSVRGGFNPQQRQEPTGAVARDTKLVVPAIDFPARAPRSNDVVARGGTEYRVLDVLAHFSGELPALYELRVGR